MELRSGMRMEAPADSCGESSEEKEDGARLDTCLVSLLEKDLSPAQQSLACAERPRSKRVDVEEENRVVYKCEYKPDGVDRDCSGFYSSEQSLPNIIVQCEDVNQTMNRITRGKFWNRAKRFCKRHCLKIALGALGLG